MRAWIGLGGNQQGSAGALRAALNELKTQPGIDALRASGFFRSAPWGRTDQEDFINAVAELETTLEPEALMALLLEIEARLGRRRDGSRWGPRLVDLDLLSYQDCVLDTEFLQLPHPRMHQRAFVLVPLLQLQPDFIIDGIGPATGCLARLDAREVASVQPIEIRGVNEEHE